MNPHQHVYLLTFCLLAAILPHSTQLSAQCLTDVDLNTWTREGTTEGTWVVNGAGSEVQQLGNTHPQTLFVSPDSFLNVEINGTFQVNTNNDDDFIGFVFGYRNPIGIDSTYETLLFDWKQKNQITCPQDWEAREGYSLYRIDTTIGWANGCATNREYFWQHTSTTNFERLDSLYGPGTGWNDNQAYDFRLIYTATQTTIIVDNDTIFDVSGCFKTGRFGFYNYSQNDVIYSNFSYKLKTDYQILTKEVCMNDTAKFRFADTSCTDITSTIDSVHWSFGDGTTNMSLNPKHVYTAPGNYDVTMVATDYLGCKDTVTKTITVNPLPDADFTATDTCFGDSTQFTNLTSSQNPVTEWAWDYGDGTSSSVEERNHLYADSNTYNVELNVEDNNGCADTVRKDVEVFPQPVLTDSIVDVSCHGNNTGQVFLDIDEAVHPLTYSWSTNSNNQNLLSVGAGSYDVTVTDANNCSVTNTSTVSEPPELTATWTTSQYSGGYEVSCAGVSDGSIDLTVNGGVTPYSYNWNNGQFSSEDLQNVPAGTYSVTITDDNGCTLTKDTLLTEPPPLSQNVSTSSYAGGYQISCHGLSDGSIDLTVNGGVSPYSYDWNNGQYSTEDIQNLTAGTYSVVVTDANNCSLTFDTALTEPAPLTSSWTSSSYAGGYQISCHDATDGSIDLTVNGGTTPYTYDWNNGSYTSEDLTNVGAGQYTVSVTDPNGCTLSRDTTLTEPPAMSKDISAPTYSNGLPITCHGASDGQINLTVSGGTMPYTYNWSNGENTEDLSNVEAGQYAVTATDANGCQVDTGIVLNEPPEIVVDASIPTYSGGWAISCQGLSDGSIDLSVSGGQPPYSYSWNGGAYSTQDLSNISAGIYTVTVTDDDGCTAVLDTQLQEPSVLVASTSSSNYGGGYNISCHGAGDGAIDVSVSGGTPPYSYEWGSGSTSPNRQNLDAGQYSVTVRDQNGCTSSSSVNLTEPDPVEASIVKEDVTCHGGRDGQAELSVTGGVTPYEYRWSNGVSKPTNGSLGEGTYEATVSDANDCSIQKHVTVDQPAPMRFDVADTHRVVLGGEVKLETEYFANERDVRFRWEPLATLDCKEQQGDSDDCSSPWASPLNNTRYEVVMTDEEGCKVRGRTEVIVRKDKSAYVPNAFTPDGNGRNDEFRVYAKGVKQYKLRIFNRWGEEIYTTTEIDDGWEGQIDGQRAQTGTYIYVAEITYLDNDKTKKKGSLTLIR